MPYGGMACIMQVLSWFRAKPADRGGGDASKFSFHACRSADYE